VFSGAHSSFGVVFWPKPLNGVASRHLWLTDCLLLLARDIALNPGPTRYPCTICVAPVHSNQCALCCDMCQRWAHAVCDRVSAKQYCIMASQEEFPWCFPSCLLSQLPFCNEDDVDVSDDTIVDDYNGDLQIISDVFSIPCHKLRFIYHNVQGLRSKWNHLP